jgi:hypothetical protein
MPVEALDSLLRAAITEKRLVSFILHGRARIGEPHDYGVIQGDERFAGTRVAPTAKHKKWDRLYASVSTRE